MRIGLISDTHGLLRPQAVQALQGSDHIIHGGDIGGAEILQTLAEIAPLTAVRGNNDTAGWAATLPEFATLNLAGVQLFVLHDLKELPRHAAATQAQVVVCGHSHKPLVQQRPDGRLVVNPGSAGRRRFSLPISMAELRIEGRQVQARVIELA